MQNYLCELIGTALLVLLGNGVVMNFKLTRSAFKDNSSTAIAFGWGVAVMIPSFIFTASGAVFNPALALALGVIGRLDWSLVPGYIVAELLGGFIGAALLSLVYKSHLDATEKEGGSTLGCYATTPSIPHPVLNVVQEMVATFVLVLAIIAVPADFVIPGSAIFGIAVMVCAMSFGGLTGFAMNPARDLCPRIAHAIFRKGDNNWGYSWVPVIGPVLGALLAALLYKVLPFLQA